MYEEAITNLTKAAQYDQENGDILYNLANAYRQNGDTDEAIEAYTSVVTKFEGTERARRAQKYLEELNEG